MLDYKSIHVKLSEQVLFEFNTAFVLSNSEPCQWNILFEKFKDSLLVILFKLKSTFLGGDRPYLQTWSQRFKNQFQTTNRDFCLVQVQMSECAAVLKEASQILQDVVVDALVFAEIQRCQL